MSIPYAELHISNKLQQQLENQPDVRVRIALATGVSCSSDSERLGLCVFLASDEDKRVANAAKRTLKSWSSDRLLKALKRDSHSKILEYIIEFLETDARVSQEIFRCFNLNERTAYIIARRCDERTCEEISKCRQQLLLYPQVYWEIKNNPIAQRHARQIEAFFKNAKCIC